VLAAGTHVGLHPAGGASRPQSLPKPWSHPCAPRQGARPRRTAPRTLNPGRARARAGMAPRTSDSAAPRRASGGPSSPQSSSAGARKGPGPRQRAARRRQSSKQPAAASSAAAPLSASRCQEIQAVRRTYCRAVQLEDSSALAAGGARPGGPGGSGGITAKGARERHGHGKGHGRGKDHRPAKSTGRGRSQMGEGHRREAAHSRGRGHGQGRSGAWEPSFLACGAPPTE
jgi:hypothetical protein